MEHLILLRLTTLGSAFLDPYIASYLRYLSPFFRVPVEGPTLQ
jgi:hypothetical protein